MAKKEENKKVEKKETKPKNENLKWYFVTGISGQEKRIAELVKQRVRANEMEDKITEVIVPTQEKIVIKDGKKKTVEERIFPGYILLQMEVNDETMHLVRNSDGVRGFVGTTATSKTPTPLSTKEVRGILAFTEVKQEATFKASFKVSDAVKVTDGPFRDFVGTVQDVNESKGQVTVLLSMFDREVPVQLDFLQVEKI